MQIKELEIDKIIPYEFNNKNHTEKQIDLLANAIKEYWFTQPIVIDKNNIIVAWHWRLEAGKKLWLKKVPVVRVDNLTDKQIKKYRLLDNKISELAEDNIENIKLELDELEDEKLNELCDINLDLDDNWDKSLWNSRNMEERFWVPPFSVLDASSKRWQTRKKEWISLWIQSERWRDWEVLGKWLKQLAVSSTKGHRDNGWVSIFDPVLTELSYKWFNIEWWTILDPFAWWSVRWIVASKLWYTYIWNDLSEKQVLENRKQAEKICWDNQPVWTIWDSTKIKKIVWEDKKFDMLFTCPPYVDLEVYSDKKEDLSTMKYEDFKKAYFKIIKESCDLLKDNRFAVIVIWEVRKKNWEYYNFVGDTIQAFLDAWLKYYNEIILAIAFSTLPLRAWRIFNSGRKIGKRHQNVLVFYKWDIKQIKNNFKSFDDTEDLIEKEKEEEKKKIEDI